jgi:hypothetical protein
MFHRPTHQFASIIFIVTALLTGVSILSAQQTTPLPLPPAFNQVQEIKPLFTPAEIQRHTQTAPGYLGVIRSRTVIIDSNALNVNDAAIAARQTGGTVALNLFDDLTLTAANTLVEPRSNASGYLWTGKLIADPYSSVILVSDGQQFAGEVNSTDGSYLIRPVGNGQHQIIEVAPAQMVEPSGNDAIPVPASAKTNVQAHTASSGMNSSVPLPLRDAQTTLDILVVYTPKAASQLGGDSSTRAVIDSLVAFANQAYADSGVQHRLRLVHAEQVNYNEQGIVNDLYAITNQDDRSLDEIHGLRDLYQADLVTLVASNGSCGIGWMLGEIQPYTANFGFNIVDVQCASGRTLAHEIGHNLGAQHDVSNTEMPGITPYAYGYQDPEGSFATMMAYSSNGYCQPSCPRIPYFSNANLSFNGRVLGNESSDVARVFNETAPFVANYRSGSSVSVGFHLLAPAHQAALPTREGTFTWQPQANANQYTLKIKSEDGSYKYKVKLDAAQVCDTDQCAYSPGSDAKWKPKANAIHNWFVKANLNGLKVRSDEKWSFSNNFLPQAINVSSPATGQTLNSTAITFTWQADERLTDYTLKVSDSSGQQIAVQKIAGRQTCTYAICTLNVSLDANAANGGYQWTLTGKRAGVDGKVKAKSNVQIHR